MATERVLRIHYPTRRYVLSASRAEGGVLEIFAPTPLKLSLHTPVRLLVEFEDSPQRFELEGRVSFQRGGSYGVTYEPGVGVAFEGESKRVAAEMLAFCAGKPLSQGTAARRRVRTQIRCKFLAGSHNVSGQVMDLSTTGLFVTAPKIPGLKVGANLQLKLAPGLFGLGGKQLAVRVLWQGEKQGVYGFGGRFTDDPMRVSATLRKFLTATSA